LGNTPVAETVYRREADHGVFTELYRAAGLEIEGGWEDACHPVFSVSARREGELLGAATVSRRFERFILDFVAVEPKARMLGIGKKLTEACLRFTAAQGAGELWLAARTPGFFRALGARETGGELLLSECLDCPDYRTECEPKEMVLFIEASEE
jgi:N-acetylglutamate synthase-like GNAT family acetyltransferase